jgi:hypothetical protein
MSTEITDTPTQDKEVTVAVPEDRVAEFYAFYARFLAGPKGRRGRGRHGHGRGRCQDRSRGEGEAQTVASEPAPTSAGAA